MVGEYWTKEEKLRLMELYIDPVRNSPARLKELVNYFRKPDASLWAITEGHGPLHVSKSLGTKIRDYQAEGALDWLMDETSSPTNQRFDLEWRGWLLRTPVEFSQAVDIYRQELIHLIHIAEFHLGLRDAFPPQRPPTIRYGPIHEPFVESVFSRDREVSDMRAEFESAIRKRDISKAKKLRDQICEGLARRIAI